MGYRLVATDAPILAPRFDYSCGGFDSINISVTWVDFTRSNRLVLP